MPSRKQKSGKRRKAARSTAGLVQGYPPPTAFWVVALVATAVLLSASRMANFAAIERPGRAIDSFVDAILDDDD